MSIPDPSAATTSAPSPAVATPARPSLKDSLRFEPKKTAVAAAVAGAGADLDRPRPPAVKSEAGELAPIEFGPGGWLSRILEAFRSLLMRLFGGLWGPSSIPPGTMVTGEPGEPAQDGRDALIQLLKEELAETRAELARLRAAASAAGLDLDHSHRAEDATVKSFEAADRALLIDKARDATRAKREGAKLLDVGEDHLRRLRDATFDVTAVAPEDRPQALRALDDARQDADAWARSVSSAARHVPDEHPLRLQLDALAEARVMADAAAEAAHASAGQAAADQEAAAQAQDIGQMPSVLDTTDAKRATELRATFLAASRRLKLLHAHEVHHVPPSEQEAFHALPVGKARMQFIKDHEEKIKQEKAALEEAIQDAALARNQAAAQLWPDDLDDADADDDTTHERPGRA